MGKRTISFSVTDSEYRSVCANAVEKGMDRPSTLAKVALMQYMRRYPVRHLRPGKDAPAWQDCTGETILRRDHGTGSDN